MNLDLALVLLMLAVAIVMFVINRPRMDAVALLVMVAMPFTGIITMNEALTGFSDQTIILIAALFVIGEGLVMTGVARRLGDWLDAKAGGSEKRLLILLMAAVGGLGSLMSSTAVVAIFIPVVLRISQNRGTAPSRLMMPLSFAALISGMLTLVATAPNLVVNAELIRQGAQGFNFLSFTPFGLPLLALGIVYMLFARGLLASKTSLPAAADRRPSLQRWIEQYSLADREKRGRISGGLRPGCSVQPRRRNCRQTMSCSPTCTPRKKASTSCGIPSSSNRDRSARSEITSSTVLRRSARRRSSCRPSPC